MSRSRRDLFVTLVAVSGVLAACVSPHKPGVSIDTLDADIVFGLTPPAAPASPPGVPQLAAPAQPAQPVGESAQPDAPLPRLQPKTETSPIVHVPCPTARQGAFPDLAAAETVTTTPAVGLYRWRPGPPQLFGQDKFGVAPNQFILKFITNVSPVTKSTGVDLTGPTPTPTETSTFTYDVQTLNPDGTSAIDSYRVEQGATRASTPNPNIGPSLRTGDPSRGLSLIRHIQKDIKGQETAAFSPPAGSPGVLLLPLTVVSSEQFQSVASDPTNGSTYTITGLVNKRAMVDACGEEIDGWEVDAQTSFTYALGASGSSGGSTVTQTANYTYYVATQLGAILTYEKVVPLQTIPTPPTGTAADGLVPPQSTVPANPVPATPYEIGLASPGPNKG